MKFCVRVGWSLFCALVSFSSGFSAPAQTPDIPSTYELFSPLLRVALMRFETAKEIWVRADPGGYLSSSDGKIRDDGSAVWKIRVQSDGISVRGVRGNVAVIPKDSVLSLVGAEQETTVGVSLSQGVWKFYRGALEIGTAEGHLRIVNVIPLESYLRGVVGGEMGAAPPEALKAQAVAARTYALYSLGKWAKEGYDLRDTSDSQIYTGLFGERRDTDQAIAATEGQILLWNGKPAATLFCADCGGATTPPTLPDTFPLSVHDDDAHGTADKPSPPAWILHYPVDKFAALLKRSDKARGTGTLDAIDTLETDVSGRVRRMRVVWKQGKREQGTRDREQDNSQAKDFPLPNLGEGAGVRTNSDASAFVPPTLTPLEPTPNSAGVTTLREITGNTLRSLLGFDTLKSTLFTIKRDTSGEFVITGRGYGHGKGLCQTGAIALAKQAFDYRAILNRYYAGVVPAQLSYSEAGNSLTPPVKTASNRRSANPKP